MLAGAGVQPHLEGHIPVILQLVGLNQHEIQSNTNQGFVLHPEHLPLKQPWRWRSIQQAAEKSLQNKSKSALSWRITVAASSAMTESKICQMLDGV